MTDNTCTCRLCEEQRERERKTGAYWLTPEGRSEIHSIWDNPTDMPLVMLTALEEAESSRASALARAEAAEAEAARRPTAHQLADMEGQRDAAEADAKEAQAALDMQRDALQAMTDMCNAAERERAEWQEKAAARQRELNDLEQHALTIKLLFEQRDAAVKRAEAAERALGAAALSSLFVHGREMTMAEVGAAVSRLSASVERRLAEVNAAREEKTGGEVARAANGKIVGFEHDGRAVILHVQIPPPSFPVSASDAVRLTWRIAGSTAAAPAPPDCDCGVPARQGWSAEHGARGHGCMHTRAPDTAIPVTATPTERDLILAALRRERIDFRTLTLDRGDLSVTVGDYDAALLIFRPDGTVMEVGTLRSGETPGKAR